MSVDVTTLLWTEWQTMTWQSGDSSDCYSLDCLLLALTSINWLANFCLWDSTATWMRRTYQPMHITCISCTSHASHAHHMHLMHITSQHMMGNIRLTTLAPELNGLMSRLELRKMFPLNPGPSSVNKCSTIRTYLLWQGDFIHAQWWEGEGNLQYSVDHEFTEEGRGLGETSEFYPWHWSIRFQPV